MYHHESHFSLSFFFYLSVTFLSQVVWASCVKTSKGIIFLPLQWYSRFLLLYFPDIYNVFFFLKCKPKTILIVHIHFPIKYRTNTNRSICLHLFSCSQRLLVERYTHSDRLITNHLWYHCSIVVKLFFLTCVFDHNDWTFASFFVSLFMDLNFLSVDKKRERKNEANIVNNINISFWNKGFII